MKSIQYPIEPPAQLPKPKLSNKKSPDSYGLWMTHDPAISVTLSVKIIIYIAQMHNVSGQKIY